MAACHLPVFFAEVVQGLCGSPAAYIQNFGAVVLNLPLIQFLIVMAPNHKMIFIPTHNCNVATVMNCNVNI